MISITLPIRTVSEANKREHWAVTARRIKEQRGVAKLTMQSLLAPDEMPGSWTKTVIRLTRIAPCKLDSGNLEVSFKGVQDGIADAIGFDDGDARLTWQYAQERGEPKQYAVRVEIEEDER